jgi:hypothetical protein
LGQELIQRARDAIAQVDFNCEGAERQQRLSHLGEACMMAAAQRDVGLARAIGTRAISIAAEASSHDDAIAILRIVMLAGAAFENNREWVDWLEEQLFDLAARLPAGEPSKAFQTHLGELKKVLDLTFAIHVRAEALASAAN